VRQVLLDLGSAPRAGMADVKKAKVTLGPVDLGLLGAIRKMLDAGGVAHLIFVDAARGLAKVETVSVHLTFGGRNGEPQSHFDVCNARRTWVPSVG
jgi:hypothetical protein